MNPDLDDTQRTMHTLVIQDSLCMDFELSISNYADGKPQYPITFTIPKDEVHEAVAYINRRTEDGGLEWVAKCGERGRHEDWCSLLLVSDGVTELSHEHPYGCSDTPPGKLLRLLGVLDYTHGLDKSKATGGVA